jgi:hypothetical protein
MTNAAGGGRDGGRQMAKRTVVKFEAIDLQAAEPGWYVRATLPHGEQILVKSFGTEAEAEEWIAKSADAWLRKYRGGRYVVRE